MQTSECPERRRLARKVAEASNAVYTLKDQEGKTEKDIDAALPILLNQARTALRNADD
jgi:hypothetical protein